jgi:hypothetical protein
MKTTKKSSIILFLCVVMMIFTFIVPVRSGVDQWLTLRPLAGSIRLLNNAAASALADMRTSISSYGLTAIILFTNSQNGGKGMSQYIGLNPSYILVKSGNYSISTGIANLNTFKYLAMITDQASTPNPKLKLYFNNIDDIFGEKALIIIIPSYFSALIGASYAVETYLTDDADGINTSKISVSDSNVLTSSDGNNLRVVTKNKDSVIEVGAFIYHEQSSPSYSGYHTTAFIIKKDSPNNTIALQGADTTGTVLSNNGKLAAPSVINRNYGYYSYNPTSDKGIYDKDQVSTDEAGYPTIADLTALYNSMVSDVSYFTNSGSLDSLAIDIAAAGYPSN